MKKNLLILLLMFVLLLAACNEDATAGHTSEMVPVEKRAEANFAFADEINEVIAQYNNGEFGEELFYITSGGGWGGKGDIAIAIADNTASLIYYQDDGRSKSRQLNGDEYERFMAFVSDNEINTLEDWDTYSIWDGIEYQYLHCANGAASTFYINNPRATAGAELYATLVDLFWELAGVGDFKIEYQTDGTKMLIPQENYKVVAVWKEKDNLCVAIEGDDGSLTWHQFDGQVIQKAIPEPKGFAIQEAWNDIPGIEAMVYIDGMGLSGFRFEEHLNNYPWQVEWSSYFVRSLRGYGTSGLWLTQEGKTPLLIAEGQYASPVVAPNTDWAICAKAEEGWAYPNKIVKIDLNTFEEYVLEIAPADFLEPVVAINESILISRSAAGMPPEYYLYDVATGEINVVQGDFSGLFHARERFLQATSNPNEFYATQSNTRFDASTGYNHSVVVVGKINITDFTFAPMATVEGLNFNSMDMWVDEEDQRMYVVINNDLLELPL